MQGKEDLLLRLEMGLLVRTKGVVSGFSEAVMVVISSDWGLAFIWQAGIRCSWRLKIPQQLYWDDIMMPGEFNLLTDG